MERASDRLPNRVSVELLDLSRSGCRVKTPVPLESREPVRLRVVAGDCEIRLTLQGRVRWQRPAGDGTWLAGCQTDCPIDWATLGELFLRGTLSTEDHVPHE